MEIATNLLDGLRNRIFPDGENGGRVEWTELHARFSAAHAAAVALGRGRSAVQWPAGGFENWGLSLVREPEGSRRINRTDLADGKSATGKEGADAGYALAGA